MKKLLIISAITLLLSACASSADKNMQEHTRKPAVAGQFYPADKDRLEFRIKKYLNEAVSPALPGIKEGKGEQNGKIRAIMVPHAGYEYSGPVAAYAYREIKGLRYTRVILLSNSHTSYFEGAGIDNSDAWETPLGTIAVDKVFSEKLVNSNPKIRYNLEAHKKDHTLEVQLPFLQVALEPGFKIVPLVLGNMDGGSLPGVIKTIKDNLGPDDLIVVSSDMSHYPVYEDANRIDTKTLEAIRGLDTAKLDENISSALNSGVANEETALCGIGGVKAVMAIAGEMGWVAEILKYANSGDVEIGDKSRVVGYGAMAFRDMKNISENKKENESDETIVDLTLEQRKELLRIARETVESHVQNKVIPDFTISDERLNRKEGAFVTLRKNGELRGCIGQIEPSSKALWQVVREMAIAACSRDNRFAPVSSGELSAIEYEISVLSVPEKIDSWEKVELGRHGVIVSKDIQSGVFLPQVAQETGWHKELFLSELCSQKAGLPRDCYKNDPEVILEVFSAQVFK